MDPETLGRARRGDVDARKILGVWLHRELRGFFARGFKEPDFIGDVIQDAVSDILRDLEHAPDDPALFRRWVYSYAGIEALTNKRDRRRELARADLHERQDAPAMSASETVVRPLIDEQQRRLVIEHAQRLRPVYCRALMHVLDGGDYRSLAETERIGRGTASSRIAYAAKIVRRSIEAARRTRPSNRTPHRET
jgi:DNA-directed RNA polymerase specialized sigma24 family protein